MTRIVFITQQVDPQHPALAATVPKIAALARRVDEVVVLADSGVPGALPPNARVRTFGAGSRRARGARFVAALAAELRPRPAAVVAHMVPLYAVLAAPIARPQGVPLLLWYTQWSDTAVLRAAERAVSKVLTVDARSFPFVSAKVVAIGHGIDTSEFQCRAARESRELRALALGRYSDVKGYAEILRAVARRDDVQLDVYGPELTESEHRHRSDLERLVGELGIVDRVRLNDAVPRARVPELLAGADVLLSNTVAGSADKVVLEAAASCVPVIASTPVFDDLLPESLRFTGADELAVRLEDFASRSAESRTELGRALRSHVVEHHSVESWAEGVLAASR